MVKQTTQITRNKGALKSGEWRKSSLSGAGNDCVEAVVIGDTVAVRDTKNRDGGALIFTHTEWEAFIGGVRQGEFDLPDTSAQP
jgi:hypothetical protein